MNRNNCFYLGNISRTHGNSGELTFWLDVDSPDDYRNLDSVLVEIDNALIPFFIKKISLANKQQAYVSVEDIDTIEKAQQLVGCNLYLPLDRLPKLGGNRFYYHEIIGFELVDESSGPIGIIADVYDLPANPLISVDHQGTEVLIPLADPFIIRVARDERRFYMNLPPGLTDVYLNS